MGLGLWVRVRVEGGLLHLVRVIGSGLGSGFGFGFGSGLVRVKG